MINSQPYSNQNKSWSAQRSLERTPDFANSIGYTNGSPQRHITEVDDDGEFILPKYGQNRTAQPKIGGQILDKPLNYPNAQTEISSIK